MGRTRPRNIHHQICKAMIYSYNEYQFGFDEFGCAVCTCNGERSELDPLLQQLGIDLSGCVPTFKNMVEAIIEHLRNVDPLIDMPF